jgi:hypothetical protein
VDRFVELDVIGALEGSDKSSSFSLGWDYLRHYQAIFAEFRNEKFNLLEIGVGRGPSLRMWKWFFPNADITGIDIKEGCARHAGERITVEIGSQTDPDLLDRICERAPPTIIVDDGSHQHEHIIFSFRHLLPRLMPGGMYVIEDIVHHGALPAAGARAARSTRTGSSYFLDIARCCFSNGLVEPGPDIPEFVLQMVDRVSFIRCAAILHKRDPARDIARAIAEAENYLAACRADADMQANYAEWICAHDGPNDRAAKAVAAALAGGAGDARTRLLQAETLLRAGQEGPARTIADQIAATPQRHHPLLLHLAALQLRMGNSAAARKTFAAAQAVGPMSHQMRTLWDSVLTQAAELERSVGGQG